MKAHTCSKLVTGRTALLSFASVFLASAHLRALDASALQAMVIVQGDEGRGSAFVVKMDGRTFLVTNSHVVRGNRNVKFKSLRNEDLATGPLQIADKVDAVRSELSGAAHALELMPEIEQKVKIGDEIVVAGNAEGEGVVREIPGKVVGIGPDRIEVDAGFVPGNSGSPILLKSTGQVIGVATYLKIPWQARIGVKSATSLNEVRRFGYRLDTVARWITPSTPDHLFKEGLKLAEMDEMMSAIASVFVANAGYVSKWGSGNFVSKEQAEKNPGFAAVAAAIDGFVKKNAAAEQDEEKKKNVSVLFGSLKTAAMDQTGGLEEGDFSGFFAVQFKEQMTRRSAFFERFDGAVLAAYRDSWLAGNSLVARRSSGPPIDLAKLKLVLSCRVAPTEPPTYRHHVSYPPETEPANLDNLFWIVEDPKGVHSAQPMHRSGLRVHTPVIGAYRVYVEYRGEGKALVTSNVVEINVTELNAASDTAAADKSKPLDEILPGTRWLWFGSRDRVLEFQKDGKVGLDDWTRQGLVTGWQLTGPSEVTLSILSGRKKNLTATLNFSDDRRSFTGLDFDAKRVIAKSPRVAGNK